MVEICHTQQGVKKWSELYSIPAVFKYAHSRNPRDHGHSPLVNYYKTTCYKTLQLATMLHLYRALLLHDSTMLQVPTVWVCLLPLATIKMGVC